MNRTCFVSAPSKYDLRLINRILRSNSVRMMTPFDDSVGGVTVADRIKEAIESADFFIAIVPSKLHSPNVFFELGIAASSQGRILLITDKPAELPVELSSFFTIQAGEDDTKALEFSISQFVSQPKGRKISARAKEGRSLPLGALADRYSEFISKPEGSDSELEATVAELLTEAGAEAVSQYGTGKRADLAVWLDEIEDIAGNPILVEVKSLISNDQDAANITDEVEEYLHVASAKLALVLYLDGIESDRLQSGTKSSRVLFFKLGELLANLKNRGLGEIIRRRRNHIAHGGLFDG